MAARDRLDRDEVHVWTVRPDAITERELVDRYALLESDDERERRLRLRFERDRHERLVSVALVRTALSRYAAIEPADWKFARNEFGRPDPVPGQCEPHLRFNLSHTRGLAACAVTVARDVGCDVECVDRACDTGAIADRYFSRSELRDLRALPRDRRRERFFDYWTLKESYIKARGMGLRIPLGRFSFHLDDGPPVRVSFDPELEDDPADWQFELHRPGAGHVLAVGVRRGRRPDLRVRVRSTVPLRPGEP